MQVMSQYKIKEGQTILDVSNQLLTNTDSIQTILSNNENINVNLMNENEIVEYDPISNFIINQIQVNNYVFTSRDNVVYQHVITESIAIGVINLSELYSDYINNSFYKIEDTGEYGFLTDNTIVRIFNKTTISLYSEPIF